ncbi:MAG: 2-oxoglutarate dehydrogenase complex dihydrolipoyllysine-residue succinyltransferase [Pelagibacteraceae bacterium]|jgi:2-oxoglutarate dehydrogenase E2 component (dihydrolipoamide succinyltransferase)|nr:2-oxoglutarate dehydrogenase complex dihydrolipoyllysine-residue succinyltransferase [Pelagibacteraceae bacterium]MDP6784292.1 2-oxoglutarate dehydrogenase complex dihydrolipoyllysine-residue succinyltransferase [Alphaproteobacteria bacterium]MBO6468053.1 2-oxoglutarate dehydrogenase complex dihydrolipoyllysine-residue succinyltransferase [Pelagibacteraceae bacterium]MBO6469736.1 2-oxoglutarate dehydrogenase complex dihydrolipoyllysine-residue succinyltransferase [Pelagibacteraceae bacterium]|tara:strand:+ start:799 stop:1995 length:1197 start_codon:yes stop_codon:yes gene_type:complete
MSVELKVPTLGESITEATVSKWLKKVGESFEEDEPLVEIETDKITVEVSAPSAGVLSEIKAQEGKDISIGGVLGLIDDSNRAKPSGKTKASEPEIIAEDPKEKKKEKSKNNLESNLTLSPSVKKILEENNLVADQITPSRDDGRLTKADVMEHMQNQSDNNKESKEEQEEIVPMSKIRRTIATRLKEAQNTAAILTTFNEVDMSEIIEVRESKKEDFMKRYGVKLGFMSFFIKASVMALQEYSAVNAEIRDDTIVYKNHFDIGIAVGTEKGLVVPVLKNADQMTFDEIERQIVELSSKAKKGTLTIDDLSGGTFTISNGGVYGSLLSTPIINPPQSGILGMHNIVKRAIVLGDEIVIRPMMYLAFSYDHRIVDGKESVGFLIKIKEFLENPSKTILGI